MITTAASVATPISSRATPPACVAITALKGGPMHKPKSVLANTARATNVALMSAGAKVCMPTKILLVAPEVQKKVAPITQKNPMGEEHPTASTEKTVPATTPPMDTSAMPPS